MSSPSVKSPSQLAAYEDLFQRLLDCTLLLEPGTHVVLEANVACERVLGVPLDQVVGSPIDRWIEADCRDAFAKTLRVAMRRYYPRQFDTRCKTAGGRILHMDVLACSLDLADGTQVMQIIARDITFRREAEERMHSLLQKLAVLSTVDEMTGLHNFRYFKTELEKEHLRALRQGSCYSIVFCDVDHFKKYNDRNGHPAGDRLLRQFAATLQQTCRMSDLVARYGGEEFAIICTGTDIHGASMAAERVRVAIAATRFEEGEHQPLGKISVSIGVASYPMHGQTHEEVLKAADEAVYASKAAGRDRVTVAKPTASRTGSSAA